MKLDRTRPWAHNVDRYGPNDSVPVVIENPGMVEWDESEWHEATDEEYAAYVEYWDRWYEENDK